MRRNLAAITLALSLAPATGFGQGGVVGGGNTPPNFNFHYQHFLALTPKGQVFVLEYDTQAHQLIQANQPVWSMAGVTAIAPAYAGAPYDAAGGFFAITSDRRIYYVDASTSGHGRARLISTDAPADQGAIGYFGCNGTLYTIPASGLLTTRTLGGWGADKLPTLLTAPIQAGTGWQNVSEAQCVQDYSPGNQVYATDANGTVNWYRQTGSGVTAWTQRKTNLAYVRGAPALSGVHIFGVGLVLEARYAGGPGATLGGVTQGVRIAGDGDGMTWPQGSANVAKIIGGANLMAFKQVVFDSVSYATIG